MERKRKLPARAAARVESESKRRHSTPREKSEEPPAPPVVEETPAPPPLPRSVQAGKPLPTVEDAQPDDLSVKEYQSVGESGVLSESLTRSRHKWIQEGLFEKYWTKPHKKKGVVHEDPKNPPKESMTKVGTVTITVEPHIIEATMYAVKDPKPKIPHGPAQNQASLQTRPIIQYGPPNGSMPAPANLKSATASPAPEPAPKNATSASASPLPQSTASFKAIENRGSGTPKLAAAHSASPTPVASPAPSYPPRPPQPAPIAHTQPSRPVVASTTAPLAAPRPSPNTPQAQQPMAAAPNKVGTPMPAPAPAGQNPNPSPAASSAGTPNPGQAKPVAPAPAAKPAANDPVIALLAQKASGDAELRDLMKRVAVGQAKQHELAHFQSIINQLNADYKRGGGQQGPSADRLLVDGRKVRYFADEVCAILDIVLASNPNQKASDLRPPPKSDGLVVLLVKTALEDQRTKDMCRRISTGKPGFTDAQDLKDILDRLHRESKAAPQTTPATAQARQQAPAPNGITNGQPQTSGAPGAAYPTGPNPQPLRSKGHPPTPKPDVSAVVFDFGTGDRYLFPKFSILEYLPTATGQQVLASFLIVRKGSLSEYGGDPKLDYYQPVTMRVYTHTGRHLENLARVVAPQDEVRRYMDDVMDNMTRAEYILLAMRLPRALKEESESNGGAQGIEESKTARSTPQAEKDTEPPVPKKPSVLWTTTNAAPQKPADFSQAMIQAAEEETQAQYRRLINSVAVKEA